MRIRACRRSPFVPRIVADFPCRLAFSGARKHVVFRRFSGPRDLFLPAFLDDFAVFRAPAARGKANLPGNRGFSRPNSSFVEDGVTAAAGHD